MNAGELPPAPSGGGVLRWAVQPASSGAAEDLEWASAELAQYRAAAAAGEPREDLIRVYVPRPTVAFGQRDARLPGFKAAAQACRDHGFVPAVRRAGGRAAAYHPGCVVVDHFSLQDDAALTQQARFAEFAELFVAAFARAGVTSSIGEIPGEYCPGEYSIQGLTPGHPVKLAGAAQRLVKGAFLFSTHVVVTDPAPLREVLTDVYRLLGLEMDPRTVGAATDVAPGVDVPGFVAALRAEYTGWVERNGLRLSEAPLPPRAASA